MAASLLFLCACKQPATVAKVQQTKDEWEMQPTPTGAKLYYILAAASGNRSGTDWTNAFTTVPDTLERGATYLIGEGHYPAVTFDDPVSGEHFLTLRKATAQAHGTSKGWKNSYGVGQAVFPHWVIKTSYLELDGVTGGGPGSWESGLGFKVEMTKSQGYLLSNVRVPDLTRVAIRHTEFTHNSHRGPPYATAIYWTNGATHITFSHIYVHDIPGDMLQIRSFENFLLQYSKLARNYSDSKRHGDGVEHDGSGSNFTVRYCLFEDIMGTYVLGHHGTGDLDEYAIYGNVFHWTRDIGLSNGVVATLSSPPGKITNLRVYNNSIVNAQHGKGGVNLFSAGSNGTVANNIFHVKPGTNPYISGMNVNMQANTYYNTFPISETGAESLSGNPFKNLPAKDFQMKRATTPGSRLAAPFDLDCLKVKRGADGIWDRGALEFHAR